MTLLALEDISVNFLLAGRGTSRTLPALVSVSLSLERGDTLGLVGESGSGKSTLGRVVAQFVKPAAGRVWLDGIDLASVDARTRHVTGQRAQMLFQDASAAMNPHLRMGRIVSEPLRLRGVRATEQAYKVEQLLEQVGLDTATSGRYPHEFSGGQLQRIALARALSTEPDLLILDEPTSGLDVSMQARILNLLRDLQGTLGLSYIFISHDLGAVAFLAQRIAVLYLGHLVESAPTVTLTRYPAHPYTASLLAALPPLVRAPRAPLPQALGEVDNTKRGLVGCPFQSRCPYVEQRCREELPVLRTVGSEHSVACHRPLTRNS